MAEGEENYEMDDLGKEEERGEDEEDTDETNSTGEDHRTITIGWTSDRDGITRVADRDIPNARRDAGAIKRSITAGTKRGFSQAFEIEVNVRDGKESEDLIKRTKFNFDKKDFVSGVRYDKRKIYVRKKGGGIKPSTNKKREKAFKDFWEHIGRVEVAHSETLAGAIEEVNNNPTTSQEVVDDIRSRTNSAINDRVEERVGNLQEEVKEIVISKHEVSEFAGTLHPQGTDEVQIEALERQVNHYRLKELREADLAKERFYRSVKETAELKADSIRIRIGERPKYTEAVSILENEVENNDLNRLERFKKWARKNMVGLSAIAITIAGIVTTIVVATRNVVSGGAKAVGGFAKALANLGKSLGPLLAPLFSLVAQALTWGPKGIAWLANNLWVLAIAMAWLLYDYWKNRK